ncbi:MAG: hypothetical protein AB1426_11485 [Bacillota bacterium]
MGNAAKSDGMEALVATLGTVLSTGPGSRAALWISWPGPLDSVGRP